MVCPKCGKNNPDDAVRCHKCGEALVALNERADLAVDAPEVTEKKLGTFFSRVFWVEVIALILASALMVGLFVWNLRQTDTAPEVSKVPAAVQLAQAPNPARPEVQHLPC